MMDDSRVYVSRYGGLSYCRTCGKEAELRLGACWECANAGELRRARLSPVAHLLSAIKNVSRRRFDYAKYDLRWAYGRLTNTGDYRPGGYLDKEHPGWREVQP